MINDKVIRMALPLTIDDFTTGRYTKTLTNVCSKTHYGGGESILGGARFTNLLNSFDPRHTPVTLDVGSSDRLNVTLGAMQSYRLEVGYGFTQNGEEAPLGLDLFTMGASAIRTNFQALNGASALNYNAVAYFASGGISTCGTNLAGSLDPFMCDFPLVDFAGNGGNEFRDLSFLVFVFQASNDLALNSFEIV